MSDTLPQSPSVARTPLLSKNTNDDDMELPLKETSIDEPIQTWTLLRLFVVLLHVGLTLFYYVKQSHDITEVVGYNLGKEWMSEWMVSSARKIAMLAHEPSELNGILQFGQVHMVMIFFKINPNSHFGKCF
jgi:hypothetical protein